MSVYVLSLTTEQAELVHRGLEFYARIGIGQLEEVLHHPAVVAQRQSLPARSPENARELVTQLKDELFNLPRDAGQSIYSEEVPDATRVVWDIRNVIRHKLASDQGDYEPTRDFSPLTSVAFDTPRPAGSQALPVMENVTELEQDMAALKGGSADLQERLAVVLRKLGKA